MAAVPPDSVDLIDEDEARRILLSLFEHVADAGGTHTDEHLDKVRSTDGEEGNIGFACDRSREQRLARSRRANHEDAFGDAAAQLLEFLGILKKIDELRDLFLGFLDAGDVLEGDPIFSFGEHPRFALAEIQRASTAILICDRKKK